MESCELRPSFRPAKSISAKEEVRRYCQRDFRPSHIYRLGQHLFKDGDKVRRRRLITPISADRIVSPGAASSDLSLQRVVTKAKTSPETLLSDEFRSSSVESQQQTADRLRYKKFLLERITMRNELEAIGDTKTWLSSKHRNPLEERQYQRSLKESSRPITEISLVDTMETAVMSAMRDSSVKERISIYRRHKDKCCLDAKEELDNLKLYCELHGLNFDKQLAERALLSPEDNPNCHIGLRQFVNPMSVHSDMASKEMKNILLRRDRDDADCPPRRIPRKAKPETMVLSTGTCSIQASVNCWLNFKQYQQLSKTLNRRYDGRKGDAFWPGQYLDLLRLPEMDSGKARSLGVIFRHVLKDDMCTKVQVSSWPDNSRGYVQLGSKSRKQFHI